MQCLVLLHQDPKETSFGLVVKQLVQLSVLNGLFGNSCNRELPTLYVRRMTLCLIMDALLSTIISAVLCMEYVKGIVL
jgi:hypothetical protein